jgi:hypothetical protein
MPSLFSALECVFNGVFKNALINAYFTFVIFAI